MEMYEYGAAGIIYASVHMAVMALLRYWLYKDRLRISFRWMVLILGTIPMASGGIWLLTGGIPGVSFDILRISLVVFMFLLSLILIKVPVSENIFSYVFILAYDAAIETTSFYIQVNYFTDDNDVVYSLIATMISIFSIIPLFRCLRNMMRRLASLGADRIWGWLDLACISFLLMNLLVTLPHPAVMSIFQPIGRYMMLLGMAGIYKASERILDTMYSAAKIGADLELSKRQIMLQQSYYERMVLEMGEIRQMRHDLRHHRAAIAAMVRNGDTAALSEYLDSTALLEEVIYFTGNLAADSVLTYYLEKAKSLSVKIDADLAIGQEIPVSDMDLCVILGNLLENAVEAQEYLDPQRRYIRINARGGENSLALAVDNRFDGTLQMEGGSYRSRKKSGEHGIGLSSVRTVCGKYSGVLQIEVKEDMFMVGVVIGL